jgi:uncharacterized membrane protein YadS
MFISLKIHTFHRRDLTERHSEPDNQSATPIRRRAGKVVSIAGVFLIASLVILGVCVSFVAAYTGSIDLSQGYLNIAIPGFVIGFLLVIVGLTAALLPEGLSKDGLWVMQTGPYIR